MFLSSGVNVSSEEHLVQTIVVIFT